MAQVTATLALTAASEKSQAVPAKARVVYFWSIDNGSFAKYKGTTTGATEIILTTRLVYGPFAVVGGETLYFESSSTANVYMIFETGTRN